MSLDSYEILQEQLHGWLHRKNIPSSVRRVSTLPVAVATDIGLVRKENQDRVAVLKFRPSSKSKDMVIVALADGMGGMEGGANAASLTLSTFFTEIVRNSDLTIHHCLERAVLKANEAVLNVYKGNGGATLTALAIDESENIIAVNVGDSRIYELSTDNILQISEDDTLAVLAHKYNLQAGHQESKIDARFGGELIQFIGLDGALEIHFHKINQAQGRVILLSSDGAHLIGKENLRKLFANASNTGIYSRRIIDLASWFGGVDNASVAIIEPASLLKELDVSSGNAVNVWDSFGELRLISVGSSSVEIKNDNFTSEDGKENIESDNKALSSNIDVNGSEKYDNKKNIIEKRRQKTKSKNRSSETPRTENSTDRKKKVNNNNKLEDLPQLDIPFSERDSVKGDKNEK